ncbi:DUF4926 domain-containing protein [Okeania sp.]|uniref:DUF4926 domain-containing protein n=1 Tax=Okeania sp. TaxID=3100323 RepID=UPI002B4B3B10|nr:DUF4926 domain-containing protein [Okeania sp.]MEB3342136.1 DUF4926 domain-containing protein [Okeania sp.]
MNEIRLHDTVALTKNMKTTQFMTDQEIILPRGKAETVVEIYDLGKAFEVEFANKNGIIGVIKLLGNSFSFKVTNGDKINEIYGKYQRRIAKKN